MHVTRRPRSSAHRFFLSQARIELSIGALGRDTVPDACIPSWGFSSREKFSTRASHANATYSERHYLVLYGT
ncbi:hypothetical protein BJX68DRAFT_126660 [Aspergillus pseudodeflectus]|uniref:Uncharacterized protein n=1 Tax=Aspergillus pseudodeflectus TaxID=176178 RepID=A0ABR4K2I6_9EURO